MEQSIPRTVISGCIDSSQWHIDEVECYRGPVHRYRLMNLRNYKHFANIERVGSSKYPWLFFRNCFLKTTGDNSHACTTMTLFEKKIIVIRCYFSPDVSSLRDSFFEVIQYVFLYFCWVNCRENIAEQTDSKNNHNAMLRCGLPKGSLINAIWIQACHCRLNVVKNVNFCIIVKNVVFLSIFVQLTKMPFSCQLCITVKTFVQLSKMSNFGQLSKISFFWQFQCNCQRCHFSVSICATG